MSLDAASLLDRVASAAGWTLLHSFWQAALLWAILVLAGRWVRLPRDRMLLGHAALATFLVAQLATLVASIRFPAQGWWLPAAPLRLTARGLLVRDPALQPGWAGGLLAGVEPLLPWLLAAWFTISVAQLAAIVRARRHLAATLALAPPLPEAMLARCRRFAGEMGLRRPVDFVSAAISDVPGTIGWLRPYVFVPPAVLLTMSPAQVEAMVLHELAHIVRADYAIAVAQSVAEAIYAANPFVRSIVRRAREDAELCCDELAARHYGDPRAYAGVLVAIAEAAVTAREARVALSARGGVLMDRVRAIVSPPAGRGRLLLPRLAALVGVALLSSALAGGSLARAASARSDAARFERMSLADSVRWILGTSDVRGGRGELLRAADLADTSLGQARLGRAIIEPATYADGLIDARARERLGAAEAFDNSRTRRLLDEFAAVAASADEAALGEYARELSLSPGARDYAMRLAHDLPNPARERMEAAVRRSGPLGPADSPDGEYRMIYLTPDQFAPAGAPAARRRDRVTR